MNDYELVTILNPEIRDENLTETIDRINGFISSRGGEVRNVDQWGRRKLAYPIARQFEGTYVITLLRLPPARAAELEANLRISEDVIRHLLVRYSPAEVAAALAASQRRQRPRPQPEEAGTATAEATVDSESTPAPAAEPGGPEAVTAEAAGAEPTAAVLDTEPAEAEASAPPESTQPTAPPAE